jgi:mannose-6-phosphate isomerase-like protein (cupin superfamily)
MNGTGALPPLRRIVTGHSAAGESRVLSDALVAPAVRPPGAPPVTYAWCTTATPCDISLGEHVPDMGAAAHGIAPPRNGTQAGVIDLPPNFDGMIHRTESLDYVVVLHGDVEVVLDATTVPIGPGDVVVQRGTTHRWRNCGTSAARLFFVAIDATPLGIGAPLK